MNAVRSIEAAAAAAVGLLPPFFLLRWLSIPVFFLSPHAINGHDFFLGQFVVRVRFQNSLGVIAFRRDCAKPLGGRDTRELFYIFSALFHLILT